MKKAIIAMAGLVLMVSCGGSSSDGGTPATPTSTDTKVAAGTSTTQSYEAVEAGIGSIVLGNIAAPLSVKAVIDTVDYTYNCAEGGSALVQGAINGSCTGSDAAWSCTLDSSTVTVDFTDCIVNQTIGGTTYEVTVNSENTGATRVTSTVSGTITGDAEGPTNIGVSGSLSGVPTVAWTEDSSPVEGTADLDGIGWTATGTGPTVACSGTSDVTIDGTTETCTISTDCSTCSQ